MSTNEKNESTGTAAVPAVSYTVTAQELLEQLHRWREQIPRFVLPPTAEGARRLANAASVPTQFIELVTIATANHKPLMRVESLTPEQVRDLAAYADAFSPLADELEALAKFVRYSTSSARNVAGSETLTTYLLAQRLSKRPETAYLAPHVADMRRALGRGRRPSPEVAAQKAAERAAKAAARAGTR
jgi:hypothetical protein